MFIDCLARAGFPAGVVNAVTGPGAVLGPLMARNPKLKKIAFTGSTATGRSLFRQSADTLKKLSLELGGSAPAILCADCDLEEAVKGTVRRAFRNNGQICIAINRIYVERAIYEEYLEKFAFAVKKLSIGDGARETVDLGPMCTKTGLEKIMRHAEDARRKGARILTGGKAPSGEKYEHGTFYEPTVIADATQDMLVMREESFGPVVGVAPFDSLDEALVLANNSPYGLAGICFTSNLNTAQKVCRLLDAGNIAINNVDAGVMNAPYGGMKESGFGYEHGPEGLFEYLTAKHLRFKYGK